MFINTHFIISKNILKSLDLNKTFFISNRNFIYGNIKPDISSRYVLSKHYLDESFSMIMDKIKSLCSLTLNSLKRYFSISKLSQELGVVCHFLCDFFTTPHSERWEFSHSMNKHVNYEKGLASYAKVMDFSNFTLDYKIETNIEDFFHKLYKEYKASSISYENDLKYSSFACCQIVNYILDCILLNTANSYTLECCV